MKKRLLLHACCGPCSTHSVKKLLEDYEVTMFWYNPNIHPFGEYVQRLEAGKEVAKKLGVELIEHHFDVDRWLEKIQGYEEHPEGGLRCQICFAVRLKETAEYAKEHGFDAFTTTMTISPHKDADKINRTGRHYAEKSGVEWVESNFKADGGFGKSVEMSKEMGIYRQKFCGCFYSRMP
ncbi:TPA: epoxyqueuosine reductase QueH [Candidatus Woesearchaeota archaeon]|nr:epoxyqueuosine reductase QueH [Candidatus Woesearchaeota archaeon]